MHPQSPFVVEGKIRQRRRLRATPTLRSSPGGYGGRSLPTRQYIHRLQERLILAEMWSKVGSTIHKNYFRKERYGTVLDVIPVAIAVFIAQAS